MGRIDSVFQKHKAMTKGAHLMRRTIASIAVAALVFGGTAVAVSAITANDAGAQESTDESTTSTVPDAATDVRPGRGSEHRAHGPGLDVAAETLGLTTDELRAELESGKTLAEVAADQGVSVDDLVAALVAEVTADIQAKVDAGELDADRAAEITSSLTEKVTAMVNGEKPVRGDGFGRGGPRGFGPGPGLDAAAETLGLTSDELVAELRSGRTLADVASTQGVNVDDLVAAIVADETAEIQARVDAGELDADRAAEITSSLSERVTAMVNGEKPVRGDGFGHGGPKGFGLDVAADTLGLTVDELTAGLRSGQTLADMASAQGVSVDDLVAAIVAEATADIQAKVDAGELDADRAAEITSSLTERVTAMVNGEMPVRGDGFGRRGPGGHHGFGTPGTDDAAVEEISISA
jgi:flagellar motility protein MotE (MotC chaperone)